MGIRQATRDDWDAVDAVYRSAFPEGERELVAKVAGDLLDDGASQRVLSLVAEVNGHVVGHTAFSPVLIGDDGSQGYILAPLGVVPEHQKHGLGSRLVERGIRELTERGADVLFVYGDPGYYGRFGFDADVAARYTPPYELQFPFGWQALALTERGRRTQPVAIRCVDALCDPALW